MPNWTSGTLLASLFRILAEVRGLHGFLGASVPHLMAGVQGPLSSACYGVYAYAACRACGLVRQAQNTPPVPSSISWI